MLTLRELLRELDVRIVAGEARAGPRRAMGAHLRARGSDAVAVRRRAAADHRPAARRRPSSSASTSRAWPAHGLSGLGLRHRLLAQEVPAALREAAAEHGFPLFEVPYEVPFIAVTEKAFSHLVNEHYAVLQRALSAHERLERIVLSERGLDGVAGALASLIGGAGADLRRARRAAGARAAGARGSTTPRSPGARPRSCASARARGGARAATRPAARWRAARWRCRCAARRRRRAAGDGPLPAGAGSSRPRTAAR